MTQEEKINVAELLKACPSGMELNCLIYEDVYFDYVDTLNIIHCYIQKAHKTYLMFNQHGTPDDDVKSKCIIFPKGKTTWEGFVPPCMFKDGDILKSCNDNPFIFKQINSFGNAQCYCAINCYGELIFNSDNWTSIKNCRLVNEEEKKKFFDIIKDKGYKWNPETKTLENLVEPWTIQYAKDGDVLAFDDETIVIFKDLYNNTSFHSYCHIEDGIFTISKEDMPDWWRAKGFYPATEEQCTLLFRKIKEAGYHWNAETKTLEKLIEPKFKVGDRVQKNKDYISGIITDIFDDSFKVTYDGGGCSYVQFHCQYDWKLVPTKFDITTLKPFKSEVLVRNYKSDYWKPAIFGFTEKDKNAPFYVVGGNFYYKCIPYEGNEYLLGKTEDCDEYFKTWEK